MLTIMMWPQEDSMGPPGLRVFPGRKVYSTHPKFQLTYISTIQAHLSEERHGTHSGASNLCQFR